MRFGFSFDALTFQCRRSYSLWWRTVRASLHSRLMRKRLRYRSVPARYHGASRQHGRRVLSEQTNKNVPAGELRSAGPWALQSSNCVARNRGGPSLRDYFLGSQLALLQRGFSFAGSEFERPYCDEGAI